MKKALWIVFGLAAWSVGVVALWRAVGGIVGV
jgi:hypothetical protein